MLPHRLPPLPSWDRSDCMVIERDVLLQNEGSGNCVLIFSTDAMLHLLCDLRLTERSRSAQGCLLNFSSSMVCPWPAVFSGLCLATIQDPSGLQQDVYIPQERTTESKLADEFTERDGWFHVRTWNYFNHDGPCTTNHVEALGNRLLKKMAWKAHPKLFAFMEVFQREQAATEVTHNRAAFRSLESRLNPYFCSKKH